MNLQPVISSSHFLLKNSFQTISDQKNVFFSTLLFSHITTGPGDEDDDDDEDYDDDEDEDDDDEDYDDEDDDEDYDDEDEDDDDL